MRDVEGLGAVVGIAGATLNRCAPVWTTVIWLLPAQSPACA